AEINRAFGRQLDSYLDAGFGCAILTEHGALMANALKYFDGKRYELCAWCVMPNHVHALLFVPGRAELGKIVHSWKSYTAHRVGRGVLWAREYYDHIVRGSGELERTAEYIRANPYNAVLSSSPLPRTM